MKSYIEQSEIFSLEGLKLLNQKDYSKLNDILLDRLKRFKYNRRKNFHLLASVCGLLIDLGNESLSEKHIRIALHQLNNYKTELAKFLTKESYDYNIGNAYRALYIIKTRKSENLKLNPQFVDDYLSKSRKSYLSAWKGVSLRPIDEFGSMLFTNLSLEYMTSGRYVEALQMFDAILEKYNLFPQALAGKARCLNEMLFRNMLDETPNLYFIMYDLYSKAINDSELASITNNLENRLLWCINKLQSIGYQMSEIDQDIKLTLEEFNEQTPQRKFALNNFLTLSEHGLYCKCFGASKDDLMIGYNGYVSTNKKLMRLEQLLNIVKSEFELARTLRYEATSETSSQETIYQDFRDGSKFGMDIEKIRVSFRLCFGILDKIAKGICYLFDFNIEAQEKIYFERFWKSSPSPLRWQQINDVENIHLVALYSIASDLDPVSGELSYYKRLRNKLEHDVMLVRDNSNDRYHIHQDQDFIASYDFKEFTLRSMQILQITRAAIFSFVGCCKTHLVIK